MINWNTIPMVYNDSFTYMEWLGKLTYVATNHEERINDCEKNIIDLWAKVNDHEGRITELEDWRRDTVDPFIVQTNFRLGKLEDWRTNTVDPFIASTTATLQDHENRITAAEDDIDALQDWKDGTVTPFITDITTWKDDTVDPFIEDIGPRVSAVENNAIELGAKLTSETAARRNGDNALDEKINKVNSAAVEALNKVNRIDIDLQNIGTVRYFMATATVNQTGGNTSLSTELPDEDWVTIDVRFAVSISNVVKEFRLTTTITNSITSVEVDGITFNINYDSGIKTITVTAVNETWAAADIARFDYILYKGALTEAAQEQRDIAAFDALDIDANGKIDAREASFTLAYYADAATSKIPEDLSGKEAWAYWVNNYQPNLNPDAYPDFNGDDKVDARDASSILAYYAWLSTTDTTGLTGPQALKRYKTELEAGNA